MTNYLGVGGSGTPEGQLKPFLVTNYKARESQTSACTRTSELSHSYLMGDEGREGVGLKTGEAQVP